MFTQFSRTLGKDLTLLYEVTKANFKLQNENTYLGILWYLLGPMLLFGILLFVFTHRLGSQIEHYSLYVLIGIISWNMFATGVAKGMIVVVNSAPLLKALPIRTELLVLSSIFQIFLSHCFEILFFFSLLLWYGIFPTHILLYVLIVILSLILTIGFAMTLATAYVYLRDVHQIWSVITRAWWFATPIFYAPTPTGLGMKLSLFNPLYYVIHLQREVLIYDRIPPISQFVALAGFAFGALFIGSFLFRKFRDSFIEFI